MKWASPENALVFNQSVCVSVLTSPLQHWRRSEHPLALRGATSTPRERWKGCLRDGSCHLCTMTIAQEDFETEVPFPFSPNPPRMMRQRLCLLLTQHWKKDNNSKNHGSFSVQMIPLNSTGKKLDIGVVGSIFLALSTWTSLNGVNLTRQEKPSGLGWWWELSLKIISKYAGIQCWPFFFVIFCCCRSVA